MDILFLTSELPYPPFAGAPMRNFGLIEGLAGHNVWLLTFAGTYHREPPDTPLRQACVEIATINPPQRTLSDRLRDLALTRKADILGRFYAEVYERKLIEWLTTHHFDLIQVENLEMAVYLPTIKQYQPDTPVIYDAHNAEYALQQRIYESERETLSHIPGAWYSYIQAGRVRELERRVCQDVDHVIAVSDTDAQLLRDLGCKTPVSVVPNGISTSLYESRSSESIDLEKAALVFTGKMDYRPNVDAALWFAQDILPLVRLELPSAHFYVVGQSPHARLDVLRGQAGITLTGLVPEIIPYLQAASVFVVPLRMGSGTRLKVLEAMACGCPIVSTPIGAQGLTITDGQDLLLAENAQDFAQAVIRLHRDPTMAQQIGGKAQQFVKTNYDWSVLLPRLFDVYKELGVA